MTPKQQYYRNAAQTIIKNLQKRRMEGYYFDTSDEALESILSLMPDGSSLAWGGSQTLKDIGLLEDIKNGDYTILDRHSTDDPKEKQEIYTQIFNCDYYLMSTNAITMDGELINIDGTGNRVASLCFGPKHVIIVAGMNKVVSDLETGIKRAQNVASAANNIRFGHNTPCANTGRCTNCVVDDCICSQIVVTRFLRHQERIKVFLIGENLGY